MKAAATNRPPTTPPTMAGTLALWSVLLLIGLGDGGDGGLIGLGDGGDGGLIGLGDGGDEGHPPIALHNIGFPKYLWHCQKKRAQTKMY